MPMMVENAEYPLMAPATWQERGHASHNGVVTDLTRYQEVPWYEVMSDKCAKCLKWEKKTNDPRYQERKASHNCMINHAGSADSM